MTLPEVPTDTCRVCGADLSQKAPRCKEITPAGGFCAFHVKDHG